MTFMITKRTCCVTFFYISCMITPILLVVLFLSSFAFGVTRPSYYKGAVVEFSPDKWNGFEKPEDLILRNARRYIKIIEQAGKENTDIIVFPECGLTTLEMPIVREKLYSYLTFIPNVDEHAVPCSQQKFEMAQHLQEISCAAKNNKIYVVINLDEKVKCDKTHKGCPDDGLLFYNTNIVFDREGKIIAKYHKFNLFREPEINATSQVELTTFETDFGVTFGMFICFDILFPDPSIRLIKEKKVKNIVYSTAWFSELPMVTASQIQAAFSYAENVNFLAAGYSRPEFSNGGSGIYSGHNGPLVATMPEEASTKLLIAKVSSNPSQYVPTSRKCNDEFCSIVDDRKVIDFDSDTFASQQKGFSFLREDLTGFKTEILNAAESNIDYELNDKQKFHYENDNFKCEIIVTASKERNSDLSSNGPVYRLIGYSGKRSYAGIRTVKLEVCGLIACQGSDFKTCGLRPNFDTNNLTNITSVVINTETSYISTPYVTTLDKDILPLLGSDVSFSNDIDKRSGIQSNLLILENPHSDLITFGIYKS